jgi:hypothetical protein
MINQEKINFKVTRDFGETFNVSIKFLRQNFKSYFLCLLFLAGPMILLYSCSSAYYQTVILYKVSLVKAGRLYNMNIFTWEYFLSIFFQFLSYLSMMCCTYAYMLVYQEKGKGNFTTGDVARKMNASAGKIIGAFFLFFFLITIFVFAIILVYIVIAKLSTVLGVLIGIGLFIGAILLGPTISWQLSTSFLVILADDETPISGYTRTKDVMKRNHWWTWLIMVCASLMVVLLSLLFTLPKTIYSLVLTYSTSSEPQETSFFYLTVLTVCTFAATLVYSIIYIICGFHYFSLAEKSDGTGLMERINEIGKSTIDTKEQQQF